MQQLIKRFSWMAFLALGLQTSRAFSLAGPIGNNPNPVGPQPGGDSWQQPVIGYNIGELDDPKNLGEEYRRNTPEMYYAFDANFLDYFGSNGVAAVEGAVTIMNNITNVDNYSHDLSEFPLESRHVNGRAYALGLYDLKSWTLYALEEQMGLVDPVTYDWTLHDRFHVGNIPCPVGEEYLVVQRNFDFISSPLDQIQYSPYVNDTLYSYQIYEACTGPNPLALAVPFSVDPLADTFSPVASLDIGYGEFYSGLTRDDVAGFRYLLSTNNVNYESPATGSVLLSTNIGTTLTTLTTSNLTALFLAAQTNNLAAFSALYPDVEVLSQSNSFVRVDIPNVISYFTNYNGEAYGTPPHFIVVTNGFTQSFQEVFMYTFANVVTNGNLTNNPGVILNNVPVKLAYSPNTVVTNVTTSLGTANGQPYPAPFVTNIVSKRVTLTNVPSGEYFVIPPGQCGWEFVSPQPPGFPLTNVVITTNIITSATNTVSTNVLNGFVGTESTITYFTNHTYVVQPIFCNQITNATGLYQGIEHVQFVRANFDALLGQYFQPITNDYTMVAVDTNSQPVTQYFQRIVTAPDVLFSADDLASGPSWSIHPVNASFFRNINFDQSNVLPGEAGPGVIEPTTRIGFNKVGPVYFNYTTGTNDLGLVTGLVDGNSYFTEAPGVDTNSFYLAYFLWASFDGSTNPPTVYPNGTSIDNLENQVLIQIYTTPTVLPNGTNGVPYSASFAAMGGQPPYTWSSIPSPLAPGLTLSPAGVISGTPTQSGTYDFTVQLNDSSARTVQLNYSIIIQ
ncbi:MAG: Ig domain-containing protein [Limisphaerales bacterium]